MKKQFLVLLTLLMSSTTFAGAVSSGGGAPPFPVYPDSAFQYQCDFKMDRIQADSAGRHERFLKAQHTFSYDKSETGFFKGSLDLNELQWQSEGVGSVKVSPQNQRVSLRFEKSASGDYTAIMDLHLNQESESGEYDINTYKNGRAAFNSKESLQVETNVEERAKWINNQPPRGLSMNHTGISVVCVRTK